MTRRAALSLISLSFAVLLGLVPACAQDKPDLAVHPFTVASGVNFPYDMRDLQTQAIVELKSKNGGQFNILDEVAPSLAHAYVLDGEVTEWHKGNTAERMLIAAGSVAGRENAKIHYWLTGKDGKRVFEQTDTIRQLFMRNAHERSAGTLVKPFGDKISERLSKAKLGNQGS